MNEYELLLSNYGNIKWNGLKTCNLDKINQEISLCDTYMSIYEHMNDHIVDVVKAYIGDDHIKVNMNRINHIPVLFKSIEDYILSTYDRVKDYIHSLQEHKKCIEVRYKHIEGYKKASVYKHERKHKQKDDVFYSYAYSDLTNGNFVVIDIETTGLDKENDEIIEVAAIKYENYEVVEYYHTYCDTDRYIEPHISKLNGIYKYMIKGYPKFEEIVESLDEFIGDYDIVCHNTAFDLTFMHICGSNVFTKHRRYYDTLEIALNKLKRGFEIKNFQLGTLCDHYHIDAYIKHNALFDALACGELFKKIKE